MGNFRKNKRTASTARGRVDKAQNQLLKGMKRDIDELKSSIETKYSYQIISSVGIQSYDGSNDTTRQQGIYAIGIGDTQGVTDSNQRIGDKVSLKHIDFNYRLNLDPAILQASFTVAQTTVRVMMFWDNQPTAIDSTGAMVTNPVYWNTLLHTCVPGTTLNPQKIQDLMSEKDWDQRKRFSIIYNKYHTLIPTVATVPVVIGQGPRSGTSVVQYSKNYKGQSIRYVSSGTKAQNRQLYVAFLSDSPNAIPGPPVQKPALAIGSFAVRTLYEDA